MHMLNGQLVVPTRNSRAPRAPRAHARDGAGSRPPQVGTLEFVVPTEEATHVRGALSSLPCCWIRSCVAHPTRKEVSMCIAFAPGMHEDIMDLLMARAPAGQFGRCGFARAQAHEAKAVLQLADTTRQSLARCYTEGLDIASVGDLVRVDRVSRQPW